MNFLRNNIISRFFRRVTSGLREVTQTLSRVTGIGNRRGSRRGSYGGNDYDTGQGSRRGKGLKDANRNNVDKSKVKNESTGYIDKVDNFSSTPEPEYIQPVYHYGKTVEDANIGSGYAGLGESVNDDGYEREDYSEETKDLWETDTMTEEDEEFYKESIQSVEKEDTTTRNEIIKFYMDVAKGKDEDDRLKETDRIIKEIYQIIPLNDITHVPYVLGNHDKITKEIKQKVQHQLTPEFKDEVIEQEMGRYRSIIKDFLEVTEKDGKYFLNDWKFGIKTIDFLVKAGRVSEIMLLLTPFEIDEVVKVLRTGYMPRVIQETPFGKIAYILEGVTRSMVNDTGSTEYNFPKAYYAYKRRLPMYEKLRNNGRLADVNAVLRYFYNGVDKVHINGGVEGDAFLGLIEPKEFISSYIRFFYGNAKQTQVMGEVTEKLMKQNPNVLLNMTNSNYTDAQEPEGAFIVFAGHIVTFIPNKNGSYIKILDKSPSNITGEGIKGLANMVTKEKPKKKEKKKEVPKKGRAEVKDSGGFDNYYDHEGAMKLFEEKKNKPNPKPKKVVKTEPEPEEEIESEVEEEVKEEVKETELVEEEEQPYLEYINMLERKESVQVKLVTGGVVNTLGGVRWTESVNGYVVYKEDYTDGYEYDEVVIKTPEEAMDEIIYWLTKGEKSLEENLLIGGRK